MAASLKELFQNFTVKIGEKIRELQQQIGEAGGGGTLSPDEGNDLTLDESGAFYFKQRTPEEIAAAYEGLADVNRFSNAYKQTVDNFTGNLSNKADLDPATGKLRIDQVPKYSITDVINAAETTLAGFIANVNNYTFDIGDVVVIDNAGSLTHYFYNGEDRTLETSYSEVNPASLSTVEWGSVSGKPLPISELSGINTGDQDLSGLALDSEVVKSVSTNNGTPVTPDENGNVDITVESGGRFGIEDDTSDQSRVMNLGAGNGLSVTSGGEGSNTVESYLYPNSGGLFAQDGANNNQWSDIAVYKDSISLMVHNTDFNLRRTLEARVGGVEITRGNGIAKEIVTSVNGVQANADGDVTIETGGEVTAQAITDALTYTPLRGVKTSDGEEVPVVGGFAELPENIVDLPFVTLEDFGAVGDNVTDDSQAFIDALDSIKVTGGRILLKAKTYLITQQITFPDDLEANNPRLASITIVGVGANHSGRGTAPKGGSLLNLTYSGTYGKIVSIGLGYVEIHGVTFTDTSNSSTPFIYGNYTTWHIHDCGFYGTKAGINADQDAIVLGGTENIEGPRGLDNGFQGYGTVIKDNYFSRIRRAVYGRVYFNANIIQNNTLWNTCGSNLADGAGIELDGNPLYNSSLATGNVIQGNLIESTNYPYSIKLLNSERNTLSFNNFYDPTGTTISYYFISLNSGYNYVISGFHEDSIPFINDAAKVNNTIINHHQNQESNYPESQIFKNKVIKKGPNVSVGGMETLNVNNEGFYHSLINTGRVYFKLRNADGGSTDLTEYKNDGNGIIAFRVLGSNSRIDSLGKLTIRSGGVNSELWLGDTSTQSVYIIGGILYTNKYVSADKFVSEHLLKNTARTFIAKQTFTDTEGIKEHQINGTRLTANITGTFNFDWNAYSQFVLTPTGAVTLGNVNLPTGDNTKVKSGIFKASAEPVTFPSPAFKAAKNNDPLSATEDTHCTLEVYPDFILYTLENIPA